MMCTMETHVNQVLCFAHSAVKPTSVINCLKSKQFQIILVLDIFKFFK